MSHIDLNADLGEGFAGVAPPDDATLLTIVTSANIACGYHAGDAVLMRRTVVEAAQRGVAIGAHPGYPDPTGFGRRNMDASAKEVTAYVIAQIGALDAICRAAGTRLRYVKAHGALYNRAVKDVAIADAIAEAIRLVDSSLAMLGLPNSALLAAAERAGLRPIREGFADRGYKPDGTLVPRTEPGALLTDPNAAADQAEKLASGVDTICVHSDTPGSVNLLRAVSARLTSRGYTLAPFAA
ncbi:MAG TPA: 5-oxoprolinase subunit PxpA [Gemmatimonadaceae bacterium]|nr:5-oxoprolinase subunit PxpA [Gemmatimonadaceae bacterium]